MNINDNISSMNRIVGTYQATKIKQPDVQASDSSPEISKTTDPNNIEDKLEISQASKDLLQQDKINQSTNKTDKSNLTSEEKDQVNELKQTDTKVKAHEQAHMAAAGGVASGSPTYKYEQGPDGKTYAVSGEVDIKISSEQDPEKTIQKAEQVKNAALAPSDPSDQDRNVARQADQIIQKARNELNDNASSTNPVNRLDNKKPSAHTPGVIVDLFS